MKWEVSCFPLFARWAYPTYRPCSLGQSFSSHDRSVPTLPRQYNHLQLICHRDWTYVYALSKLFSCWLLSCQSLLDLSFSDIINFFIQSYSMYVRPPIFFKGEWLSHICVSCYSRCNLPIGFDEFNLSLHSDMASVAKAMASPESGLEVRDRMWLKITIPNAFLGKE